MEKIKFIVTKEERKALVKVISEFIGWKPVYKGAPGFEFVVGNYTIDRYGTLIYDERVHEADAQRLLAKLFEEGFVREWNYASEALSEPEHSETPDKLAIEVPFEMYRQNSFENLERLISGKAALIMKAIGADCLPIERLESSLRFPWFTLTASSDEINAYTRFVHALCEMAQKQKRVTMKKSAVDSEKFAFRCFLLRLDFIGAEYKSVRKVLLAKLSGNSSFKSGDHKERSTQKSAKIAGSGEKSEAEAVCPFGSDSAVSAESGDSGAAM